MARVWRGARFGLKVAFGDEDLQGGIGDMLGEGLGYRGGCGHWEERGVCTHPLGAEAEQGWDQAPGGLCEGRLDGVGACLQPWASWGGQGVLDGGITEASPSVPA